MSRIVTDISVIDPEKKDYMLKNPLNIIKKTNLPYALTTYQAENLVQQYLFLYRIDLYIQKEDVDKWHQEVTLKA